jgi:predicted DNA-binding mobile mystery protein A
MSKEINEAALWGLEQRIQPLLTARAAASVPSGGWLRAVRQAMGFTQAKIAEKAGVKRQSYAQFETAEENGSVSIASLRRAAASMDCDLVYFLVPRESAARTYGDLARLHHPRRPAPRAPEDRGERGADALPVDLL